MAITLNSDAGLLHIELDHDDLERLIHTLLTPAAIKRVQVRAINETTAAIKSRLLRELPGLTGIPRKALAPRIRAGKARPGFYGGIIGKVWLGVKPIDAMALKDGGPSGQGYEAGGFYFAGGFKANRGAGNTGIFARTTNRRLPIQRQNVRIDSFANEAVRRMIRPAEYQLAQKMQRLVSYELERAAAQ